MNLVFQYPIWYIIFCFSFGLGGAAILYYKSQSFIQSSNKKWLNPILFAFRAISITIISILLLSPLLKFSSNQVEKPIVAILKDASTSIPMVLSDKDLKSYNDELKELNKSIEDKYDVQYFTYSNDLKEFQNDSLQEKTTDISNALKQVYERYENRNLGAIILTGDGIYNKGSNPLYLPEISQVPIYTIAVGDTVIRKDLFINKINTNPNVYLGNSFAMQINVSANECSGESTLLSIVRIEKDNSEKKLFEKNIAINSNSFNSLNDFVLNADQSGINHYRIRLSSVKDEMTLLNNVKDVYIDVKDAKDKVLIIADAPHPDIAAIRQALNQNKNYETDVKYQPDYNVNINDYSLIIFHQVPTGDPQFVNFYNKIKQADKSVLFIIGSQTAIGTLNSIQSGLKISSTNGNLTSSQPAFNTQFSLFTISDFTKQKISAFPPLNSMFGVYKPSANVNTFLFQKLGTVTTNYPLIAFDQSISQKIGYICGEGLYRWRLYDYLQNKNQDAFNEIISKCVQYLSIKADKKQFRVSLENRSKNASSQIYGESESVVFNAELYNEAYELVNTPDIKINIYNSSGKDFPFVFNKTFNAYRLDAGSFEVGNYKWNASVDFNNKKFIESGTFTISPIQIEEVNLTADFRLMYQISEQSGGKLFYLNQIQNIKDKLLKNDLVKPVMFSIDKTESVINLKWIFLLILSLISVEWFIRKYFGGY